MGTLGAPDFAATARGGRGRRCGSAVSTCTIPRCVRRGAAPGAACPRGVERGHRRVGGESRGVVVMESWYFFLVAINKIITPTFLEKRGIDT